MAGERGVSGGGEGLRPSEASRSDDRSAARRTRRPFHYPGLQLCQSESLGKLVEGEGIWRQANCLEGLDQDLLLVRVTPLVPPVLMAALVVASCAEVCIMVGLLSKLLSSTSEDVTPSPR